MLDLIPGWASGFTCREREEYDAYRRVPRRLVAGQTAGEEETALLPTRVTRREYCAVNRPVSLKPTPSRRLHPHHGTSRRPPHSTSGPRPTLRRG